MMELINWNNDLEIQRKVIDEKDEDIVEQKEQVAVLKEEVKKALEINYHHQNRCHEELDTEDEDNAYLKGNVLSCKNCDYLEYKLKTHESEREVLMKINFELKSKLENNQSLEGNQDNLKKHCDIAEIESDFLLMESILKATKDRLASQEKGREYYWSIDILWIMTLFRFSFVFSGYA